MYSVTLPQPLDAATPSPASARPFTWLCGLLVAAPVCFIALQVVLWVRNIPNWDEFDTVLDFLISLDAGASGADVLNRLFAVNNEHRMLVSRLIFATSYWLTGGVNFAALAVIGNLFLVATFAIVVVQVPAAAARWRLAAIFALIVLQLQHHENLFWSGASIDHFFVILASVSALAALCRSSRRAFALGCVAAFLATFSLAHGLLVWPIGGAVLAAQRRWRTAAAWAVVAALSLAVYFTGFHLNAGHAFPGVADLGRVVVFWLTLIGSSPALEQVGMAPWFGALHVAAAAFLLCRHREPREHFALAAIVWCIAAMALIAWGRALISSETALVTSRYVILSSLAWALLIWVAVERALARHRGRPWWLVLLLLLLADFNVRANTAHFAAGRVHAQRMERAALSFQQDGTFRDAPVALYPDPERADALLREAKARELIELPSPDELALATVTALHLEDAREIGDVEYCIDDFSITDSSIYVRGWAYRPDEPTRVGQHSVVFRTNDAMFAFEAFSQLRPDVAEACARPDAINAGFEVFIPRDKLPLDTELAVGICFDGAHGPEYVMTANTVPAAPGTAPARIVGRQ